MYEWNDIKGYDNYQCTKEGLVKYIGSTHTINNRWGGLTIRTKKEHIIKPWKKHHNYCCVTLMKDGKRKAVGVHRIIAGCFLGLDMDNPKIEVGHKDNNPLNNHIDNLYLTNHYENEMYKVKCGRTTKGEKSASAKLKENDILEIYNMYKKGISIKEISMMYKNHKGIYDIVNGVNWKHLYNNF